MLLGVPRLETRGVTGGNAAPHLVLGVVAAGDAVAVALEVAEAAAAYRRGMGFSAGSSTWPCSFFIGPPKVEQEPG